MTGPPPSYTLFPYTTLFRSPAGPCRAKRADPSRAAIAAARQRPRRPPRRQRQARRGGGCHRVAWSCRLRDRAAGRIVDDDRTIGTGDRGLGAVDLFDAPAPFGAVEKLGSLPRPPEINAADDAPVLGADVIFPDQPREVFIFRRGLLETSRGLGKRDRR